MELKDAIVDLLRQPQKEVERVDNLLTDIYRLQRIPQEDASRIIAVFQIIGPKISELDHRVAASISRMMKYLTMDIDPSVLSPTEKNLDAELNKDILAALLEKLWAVYEVIGPSLSASASSAVEKALIGMKAYQTATEVELLEHRTNQKEVVRKDVYG